MSGLYTSVHYNHQWISALPSKSIPTGIQWFFFGYILRRMVFHE